MLPPYLLCKGLGKALGDTVSKLIQDSNQQVQDGVQLVNRTGEALAEIDGAIDKVTEIVQQISEASADQAAGVSEINSSIAGMDEITQQNTTLVEESTASAHAMNDQARNLAELMTFFKVGGVADSRRGHRQVSKLLA